MSVANRRFVAGLAAALVGAVGFVNVYIPYYSQAAQDRRQQKTAGALAGERHVDGPGSMWKNVSETAATPVRGVALT